MSGVTGEARKKLVSPTAMMLPRVADSLSFLYLEAVRVGQNDTGVCAYVERRDGAVDQVDLPVAALACVLMGPGTSITQAAAVTLARHGTTVVYTGAGVVRAYASVLPENRTSEWLERQVRAWASDATRLQVAIRMYEERFNETVAEGTTLQRLRGMEGQRVKALYRAMAQRHGTGRFKREYDPDTWDKQDPVNQALSSANTALYGVVHAAILALGCSPALGFIHSGKQHAFVYDIADLYKAEMTIPLAFSLHRASDPDRRARVALRDNFRAFKLMPKIVKDIQWVLDPDNAGEDLEQNPCLVDLWDPEIGSVAAGVNYADEAE